jgi:hypothetical protein
MAPRFPSTRFRIARWSIAIALASAALAASCGSGNPDCDQAEKDWGHKTQSLGDSCSAGSYGSCDRDFDNCREGTCDGEICTLTCTSNSNCSSSVPYCKQGVCKAAAHCSAFCDGFCCCDYYTDPSDPTQCKQGHCDCG